MKTQPRLLSDPEPYETNPSGDLLRGVDLKKLSDAVRADLEALEPYRTNLSLFVEQYVGNYYGHEGTGYEIPLPLIHQFVTIYSRALVAKEPRCQLATHNQQMAPAVDAMENYLNDWFERIELAETMRRVTTDGLFSEGHLKVALAAPEVSETSYGIKAGQVMMCQIQEADWVCDMGARQQYSWDYCGHSYDVPLDVAYDILDRSKKKLRPIEDDDTDYNGVRRLITIGAGSRRNKGQIEDKVRLWELYLRRYGIVVTMRDDNGAPGTTKDDVLRVKKYIGPPCGPQHTIGFGTVPGNLRYLSPVMMLMPLHLAINRGYRKLVDTADDYKEVYPVKGGAMSKDGVALKNANHKELFQADNAETIRGLRMNIPPAELQLFVSDMRSAFDYLGGGLATLGGRQAMTKTATQEKILNENAGAGLGDMQATQAAFSAKAIQAACWFLWYHPENQYQTEKQVEGLDQPLQRTLYPHDEESDSHQELVDAGELMRSGPMPRLRVDPYSIGHSSPGERLQFIEQTLGMMAPYAGIMAQQGEYPDFTTLLDIRAKYGDEPAIRKLFKKMEPPQPQQGQGNNGNAGVGMEPETTRNYNRTSTAGGQQAQAADHRSKLMSAISASAQTQQ